MAYFKDLSDYVYATGAIRPGTKAVGWLAQGHAFPTKAPDDNTLDALWLYCSISVAQTRGIHSCEFCPIGTARCFERNGQRLSLGTSEIRVFSQDGGIYAAPTLIYHYIGVHQYKPPDGFLQALREGHGPPKKEYFDALTRLNLEWNETARGAPKDRVLLHTFTDPEGRDYLEQIGTRSDIKRSGLKLSEGLMVPFYRPDFRSDSSGESIEDYLLFEGTVHRDTEKGQWFTIIDPKSYRRESDLLR